MMHYVITTTLPRTFGGRTNALLKRTKLLMGKLKIKFSILTTNYDPNFFEIYPLYLQKEWILDDISLINMYQFFSQDMIVDDIKLSSQDFIFKNNVINEKVDGNTYRYYHQHDDFNKGRHFLYRKFGNDGNLIFEDYMRGNKRYLRKEYNNLGICHRHIYYFEGTLLKDYELYFNFQEKVYLVKKYKNNERNDLEYIDLNFNDTHYFFDNEKKLFKFFYEQIINDGTIIFCDARALDRPLIEMNKNVTKIAVLHGSHEDVNNTNNIRRSFRYLFNNSNDIDYLICLTEEQRQDILNLSYKIANSKLVTIPHVMPDKNIENITDCYDERFVYLGRLEFDGYKQVSHAILAFDQFLKSYPTYKLEIFGVGSDKNKLQKLAKKLGREKNILFRGLSTDIEAVFRRAVGTLVTSKSEGFCMVIMESLYYKTPVVSYSCKYGPKDLLSSSNNGYLVEPNNIHKFAEAMISIVKNKKNFKDNVLLGKQFRESSVLFKWKYILNI